MASDYGTSRAVIIRTVLNELVRRYYRGSQYWIAERSTVAGEKCWSPLSLDEACICGSGKKIGECCGSEVGYSIEMQLRGLMGENVPRLVEGKHVLGDGDSVEVSDG
jgi:hypothetical protein